MVSCTRCSAWSDQLKKRSESKAEASKIRWPVKHRDEFPDILREKFKSLSMALNASRDFIAWKAHLKSGMRAD